MTRKSETVREELCVAQASLFEVGTRWVVEPWEGPGPGELLTCVSVDRERGVVTFDASFLRVGTAVSFLSAAPLRMLTHPVITRYSLFVPWGFMGIDQNPPHPVIARFL